MGVIIPKSETLQALQISIPQGTTLQQWAALHELTFQRERIGELAAWWRSIQPVLDNAAVAERNREERKRNYETAEMSNKNRAELAALMPQVPQKAAAASLENVNPLTATDENGTRTVPAEMQTELLLK